MIINAVLALVWCVAIGPVTVTNFVVGYLLGFVLLRLTWGADRRSYFSKVPLVLGLAGYFTWELIKANVRMAYLTVAPLSKTSPGILAVPLEPMSDAEATILACMVTLTPGTLSLDITQDRRTLYVHFMDTGDAEQRKREIKEGFERRIIEVMR